MRVLVAMSGGVDSSVAAARLVAAGDEVIGVTLHLWDYPEDAADQRGRCCAPEDVHDARRVADVLGIPHYAFDRRELFARRIVEPFVRAYLDAETPSPCVHCNREVKIAELVRLARMFAADAIATGHYARVEWDAGRPVLYRGADVSKDQSYFLHMLDEPTLALLRFPLGGATKTEVRAEAHRLGLPGAGKGESQELCFVGAGRYDAFVTERAEGRVRPGPIVDADGRVVGTHNGVHAFTIGQRKNLGVALGARAYVVGLNATESRVELGPREHLLCHGALLDHVALGPDVSLPLECEASVRYRGAPVRARVHSSTGAASGSANSGVVEITFVEPVAAVVPGQFAVFYRGDRVLGGGRIRQTRRAPSARPARVPPDAAEDAT